MGNWQRRKTPLLFRDLWMAFRYSTRTLTKGIAYSFRYSRTCRRDLRSCARARLVPTARVVVSPIIPLRTSNQGLVVTVEVRKTVPAVEKNSQMKQRPFPSSTGMVTTSESWKDGEPVRLS